MEKTPSALIRRYEVLKSRRIRYEPFFRNVRDYVRPRKQGVDSSPINQGQRFDVNRFDSTAPDASRLLANAIQNALTPATEIWFGLQIPDGNPFAQFSDEGDVKRWFQDVERKMFFTMHQSNFYSVIGETYLDYTSFHTMCIYSESNKDKQGSLVYKSKSLGRFVFDEDINGIADTVFEEYELSARQAMQMFGKDDLPEKISGKLEASPDTMFTFLRCVYPRKEYNEDKLDKKNMPYELRNIFLDDKEFIGEEGGYHEFPYAIGRFDKATGENYGHGPSDIAMPPIKMLNCLKQLGLAQRALEVHPPIFTRNKNIIGAYKWVPGALIPTIDPKEVQQAKFSGNIQAEMMTVEGLVASIRKSYYADSLSLPEKSNMTATEIQAIRQQTHTMMGPTISRFETEVLVPLILRTFGLMMRDNMFPPPPQSLHGLNQIDVKFIGQMARAQLLHEVTSTQQWLQTVIIPGMQADPSILDIVDFDKIASGSADRLGVPKDFIKDKAIVERIRAERMQAKAKAEQQQEMMNLAEGAGKAAPALGLLKESMSGQQPQAS